MNRYSQAPTSLLSAASCASSEPSGVAVSQLLTLTKGLAFHLLLDQHFSITFFCLDQKKVTNRGRRSRASSRPDGSNKVKAKAGSGSLHCGQHTALQLGLLRSPQTVTLTVYHICSILILLPSDQTLTPNPLKAKFKRLADYAVLLIR